MTQVTTATISGIVHDETGAVLPAATVTVRNVGTGMSRTVTTGAEGRYRVPQLALGDYEVQAQLPGFQTAVRKGITLTLGREAVVDFTLKIGAVTESISVTGEAPLVETTSSSVAHLVDSTSIEMLPLNGRDLTQLATLQPGVLFVTTANPSTTSGTAKKISVAGARPNQSMFLMDGTDILNNSGKGVGGVSGEFLGVDSVREFNVLTSNYSAEYGRVSGGIINVVTKSGSNVLHGSAFEYHRNDNLDARNFFDLRKPEFKKNQFGGSMGGRIRKDKTFFFANYEGIRESLGLTSVGFVPTAEAREGRLPTQTIPVDPAIKPVLDLFPLPNGQIFSDGTGEFITSDAQTTSEDYVVGRMDHTFSESDSFFGRYTFDNGTRFLPFNGTPLGGYGLPLKLRGQYLTLQETKILSNNLINSARLGLNRTHFSGTTDFDVPALRFYPGRPIGQVTVAGLSAMGAGQTQPFDHPITVIQYSDDITYSKGMHALKAGFSGMKYLWGFQRDFRLNGAFNFTSLANFLLNRPQDFQGIVPGSPDTRRHYRQSMFGMYVQDDMKIRVNLTLNLGLRYEFITNPSEATGPRIAIVPNDWDENDLVNGVLVKHVFQENPSLRNISPRIGFAWDVFSNGKTSLRGGWALIPDQIYPLYYENMRVPPLVLTADIRAADVQGGFRFPNPFGSDPVRLASLSPIAMDYYNDNTPAVMQWNLGLEKEVLPATVLTARYIGSHSVHLPVANDPNTRVPDFLPDGRPFFPAGRPFRNPNWSRLSILEWNGDAFYHSLNLSVIKRWGHGFQVNGNYVFSRNIDDASSTIGAEQQNSTRQRQNPYDRRSDRGLTSFNYSHAFNVAWVVDLPFGPNQKLGSQLRGVAAKLLEGWEIQGIASGASGPPFTVTLGTFDRSRSGTQADRPDLKPGASNNPVLGSPDRYFDPGAFVLQPPGFYGNLGRNTVIGPGRFTFDFSLVKNFAIREGFRAQIRSEFFNLFNRANFQTPTSGVTGATVFTASGAIPGNAGRITSTTTSARQIQFALKLVF